ncbi:hypothetical protein BZA05DRAFT_392055 [Tricharina praecox]|uniref:uncharacterized protein n=1 Tax=Tricharina praecox TaxID=43433 RepID=UPI0022200D25|nr:uncharacterized protein BZA05DRAFT_392055 [Tricharina praecox]KAI5854612.1 hypothetical protein BZA05DRAFT_392055 [Tricharina praecox]
MPDVPETPLVPLEQVMALGISREDAEECLKMHNNDADSAAEYYWNGGLQKDRDARQWDGSLFEQSREGGSSSTGVRSYQNNYTSSHFQVQGNDVLSPDVFGNGAKSRPPTPLFGCNGDPAGDDPELAQALEASLQDVHGSHPYQSQEMGVTGTHTSPVNPNFMPAQENKEYVPSQWALTTTVTKEVPRELPPHERKRQPGCPAFLKPSTTSYNLANALTILHYIPKAREAFLSRPHVLQNYRHQPDWWSGEKIETSRFINVDGYEPSYCEAEDEIAEIQRLMAFLDSTDRAYASIDVLSAMPRVQEQESTSAIATFFRGWNRCLENLYEAKDYPTVFRSNAHQIQPTGEDREQEFTILEMTAQPGDRSLYCALDNTIWSDEDLVYVEFADVFLAQIRTESGNIQGIGLDIPSVLYPDRYSKPWLETAKLLKEQIATQKSKIYTIEAREESLKCFRSRNGKEYSPKTLLESAINHFAKPLKGSSDDDISMDSQPEMVDATPLLKEMLRKLEQIVASFERQKEEAQEELKRLKQLFTAPDDPRPNDLPPYTKYSLRGVCTDPSTTYILLRDSDPQLETSRAREEWWRCEFAVASSSSNATNNWDNSTGKYNSVWDESTPPGTYRTTKVTEEEVLNTAKTMGDCVLLVYANEEAFESGNLPLPEPLQTFVDNDNAAFATELNPHESPADEELIPSPERKRRVEDDEEMFGDVSPKRSVRSLRSVGSSTTTLDVNTPVSSDNSHTPPEMMERNGVVSPVAKAFHLHNIIDGELSPNDVDEDMIDVEHVENTVQPAVVERKGG